MSLEVRGYRVLLKLDEVEEVTESGIYIVQDMDRAKAAQQTGTVVGIGHTAWRGRLEQDPWCDLGDKVLFSKYAVRLVEDPSTKEEYGVINDDDVICVVKENGK